MATRPSQTPQHGTYNFENDLKSAYLIEREFGALLEARKDVRSVSYNDNYMYDLEIKMSDSSIIRLEVKYDMAYARTGNIAVEYQCRGKASGIANSMAQFWVFKLTDGYWMIGASRLKQLIATKKFSRAVVGGDAGSNTKMFLFEGEFLKSEMKKYV